MVGSLVYLNDIQSSFARSLRPELNSSYIDHIDSYESKSALNSSASGNSGISISKCSQSALEKTKCREKNAYINLACKLSVCEKLIRQDEKALLCLITFRCEARRNVINTIFPIELQNSKIHQRLIWIIFYTCLLLLFVDQ